MQDAYLPGPVELITDIFTLGIVLIIGLSLWLAVKECYERIDKWLWKRRSAKWKRERARTLKAYRSDLPDAERDAASKMMFGKR